MTSNSFNVNVKKPKPKTIITAIIIIIAIVLALIIIFSSFYTINETERGILVRWGKVVDQRIGSGLHFKLPIIETVEIVDISSRSAEFGFRTIEARLGETMYDEKETYVQESRMLTGELNIVDVEWVVEYRVSDPYKYVFKIENADDTLRDLSEAIMRRLIGDRKLQQIINPKSGGRTILQNTFRDEITTSLDKLNSGISITKVLLQNLRPPQENRAEDVRNAFNFVVTAEQTQKTIVEEAEKQKREVKQEVDGRYAKMKDSAKGYRAERVNKARGDVAKFLNLYDVYKHVPNITKKRMYIETISEIYTKLDKITIVDKELLGNTLPLYNLNNNQITEGGQQ